MAGQHATKAQPEASTEAVELMAGQAILFPESASERALVELLKIRCSAPGLIGSQILDQATLCGQAVKAAFEELRKETVIAE